MTEMNLVLYILLAAVAAILYLLRKIYVLEYYILDTHRRVGGQPRKSKKTINRRKR
ncbi:hypothetical protein J4430_03305 [Candidatus Woesearchaeota archaeon]|nr:hypothetical protein [Candidatus Woesearchaeota archaeon]